MLNNNQVSPIKHLLILLHTFCSNSKAAHYLARHFSDYESLLYALHNDSVLLRQLNIPQEKINALKNPDWDTIEEELEWLNKDNNNHIIGVTSPGYPSLLRETHDHPIVLFVQGNKEVLQHPQLAIVGSRNPTPLGLENAYLFANKAACAKFTVTSGLATGIDAAAHRGAIAAANGHTIAVLGTGLHHIYPRQHKDLATKIIEHGGTLVSEFPLKTAAIATNFPQRNRIISGLSLGTLVVEATLRSGSLITARLASEQGREVFAIPSSIHNPLARGCHALIRQGAKLVENIADIVDELPPLTIENIPLERETSEPNINSDEDNLTADERVASLLPAPNNQTKLLACIGFEPTPLEVIAARSNLTTIDITSMLLPLELQGCVQKSHGGYIRLK